MPKSKDILLQNQFRLSKSQNDFLLGFLLSAAIFILYAQTVVPSILDGDQGEFQYMPAFLGIPHPSGFPLYVLLGYFWSWLPIGTLAYRMNLFSAFCGALTIGVLYLALRRQSLPLVAAAGGALVLAVIPEYWQFSTAAAVYRLHNLLIVLVFAFLAEWEESQNSKWLWLAALAFGFDLSNHLTILFLAPVTAIFVMLVAGRTIVRQPRVYLLAAIPLALPILLYLYFPLRGSQLALNEYVLPGWAKAVAQGIVSPFYENSPVGFFNFVSGRTFFNTVTGNWTWQWDTLAVDWMMILLEAVSIPILVLAVIGAIGFCVRRPRLAFWLLGVIVTLQLIALQYYYEGLSAIGQLSSYFREYYLPSFIFLAALFAQGVGQIIRWLDTLLVRANLTSGLQRVLPSLVVVVFLVAPIGELASRRSTELANRSSEIQSKWDAIQRFPPAQDAALVGHWGDLTPLWYKQYAEGWRTDLMTIYPPDTERVNAWIASGKPLYLAGSLLGWTPEIVKDRHLVPWGALVRVTEKKDDPPSPLSRAANWTFGENHPIIQLIGFDVPRQSVAVGQTLDVNLYWESLESISLDDYVMYLSLTNPKDSATPQQFPLAVNWIPRKELDRGQRALGVYHYQIPWGTVPGKYDLKLELFSVHNSRALDVAGTDPIRPAQIAEILVERARDYPATAPAENRTSVDFGRAVRLLGWDGGAQRATTGDTLTWHLLWKAIAAPPGNLHLSLSLENERGARRILDEPLSKNYPPWIWSGGEIVRSTHAFSIPADLLDGDYSLVLRVDDESNPAERDFFNAWLPHDNAFTLTRVHVATRPHSYDQPAIAHPQSANFANRIAFLGYAVNSSNARPDGAIHLDLYWQGLAPMNDSYKVFVHLVRSDGQILAQQDFVPGNGAWPTTGWLPREVLTDSVELSLPPDAPSGEYQIRIGFYNGITGGRLGVLDANGQAKSDYVIIDSSIKIPGK